MEYFHRSVDCFWDAQDDQQMHNDKWWGPDQNIWRGSVLSEQGCWAEVVKICFQPKCLYVRYFQVWIQFTDWRQLLPPSCCTSFKTRGHWKTIDTFRFSLPSLVQLLESFINWLLLSKVAGFRVAQGAHSGYGSKLCSTLKNWSNCFIQKLFPFFVILVTRKQHLE